MLPSPTWRFWTNHMHSRIDALRHPGSHRGSARSIRTAAFLLACLGLAACTGRQPPPKDAYLWKDSSGDGRIHVSTAEGSSLGTLRVDEAKTADLAGSGDHACAIAMDGNDVASHSAGLNAAPDARLRIPPDASTDPTDPPPPSMIRADRHGQCLFPLGSRLGWLSAQKPHGSSIAISGDGFAWSSIDYAWAANSVALVGRDRFAVVQDVAKASTLSPVKLNGKVMGLSADSLSCCARLSPDGKTLYAIVEAGDEDMSGHTVLGAFDTSTGAFKQVYLPYFLDLPDCRGITDQEQQTDCEEHTRFPGLGFYSGKSIELESGESQAFDLSPDGHTLYVRAITGIASNDTDHEQSQMLAIDTASGKVTPLPIISYGAFAVSASGKYLFVEDATTLTSEYIKGMAAQGHAQSNEKDGHHPIRVYALPAGQFIRELPGDRLIGAWKNLP